MEDRCLESRDKLIEMVRAENRRQIEKWGLQDHAPSVWMMFLTEEVGELAEAMSENVFRDGKQQKVVDEAIQVATLALKIAEMYLSE